MKIKRITIQGAVPFPDKRVFEIPEARKIAVIGDNGSGKSTLLDCVYIALFGDTTKPGGLYPLFPTKDGLVEVEIEYSGHAVIIKRMIDGLGRKQRVYVWQDGVCLTEGKVGQANDAVAKVIGVTESVFLASVYNAQTQKGNPLSLKDGDKRSLLGEILGLGMFDEPYSRVCQCVEVTEGLIKGYEANVAMLTAQASGENVELLIGQAQVALMDAMKEKTEAEHKANELQQIVSDLNAAQADYAEASANAQRLSAAVATGKASIDDLTMRIRNNRDVLLGRAVEINDAVRRLDSLKVEAVTIAGNIEKLTEQYTQAAKAHAEARTESINADGRKASAQTNLVINQEALAKPKLVAPCDGVGEYAACPLLQDVQWKRSGDELATAGLEIALTEATAEAERLSAMMNEAAQAETMLRQSLDTERQRARGIDANIIETEKLAKLKPQLDLAETSIAQYTTQIVELESKLATDTTELARWQAKLTDRGQLTQAQANHTAAVSVVRGMDARINQINQEIGRLETKLAEQQRTAQQLEDFTGKLETHRHELRDYLILKQALGPKGARALKIDAAGPFISEIANTLLRECFGSRFTIQIKTQKTLVSDSDVVRECLEFTVIDHQTGEESPVEQKSGGEQQLIREVISLALCIYQRKQTGADLRTVIRDEACSALTEENSVAYIHMLDKACQIGGFDQVLFVSHNTCAQTLADVTIVL